MPVNIEIKARARNFEAIQACAGTLSKIPEQVIKQEDTFFPTPKGRLKLRVLASDYAQLVYYDRPDRYGPKRSDYHLFETRDPESLKTALALALGVRGVVKKTRYLYQVGQARVHLDDVEGLGQFLELEVVLRPDQSEAEGKAIAEDLMLKLGVKQEDLLDGAYMDLIENRNGIIENREEKVDHRE
jgi:predicted adenylyl cyclase CyaB